MEIYYCDRATACYLPGESDTAVISITNPGETASLSEEWGAVLRVAFLDTEYSEVDIQRLGRGWASQSQGFPAKEHALAIIRFILNLPEDQFKRVVIHCEEGRCRSAALAKWLGEQTDTAPVRLQMDEEGNVPGEEGEIAQFNQTVYALLMQPSRFDALVQIRAPREEPLWKKLLSWAREGWRPVPPMRSR